ncbi:MAG: hypothetical protein PUD72_00215 [Oscillospiraceae bacterium]|nr:hypothetical protein [Oscillospiraceae bacterium]
MKRHLTWFIIGGVLYSTIEILWRGYTHWTMTLLGGIVLMIFSYLDEYLEDINILVKAILGTFIITVLEFLFGLIINVRYNLKVWSYENVPYNILGQICPIYTFFWFILSIFAFYLIKKIKLKKKTSAES